jgi:hypothetical protein
MRSLPVLLLLSVSAAGCVRLVDLPPGDEAVAASRAARDGLPIPQRDVLQCPDLEPRLAALEQRVTKLEGGQPADTCRLTGQKTRRAILYTTANCQNCVEAKAAAYELAKDPQGWTMGPGQHIEIRDVAEDRQCADQLGVTRFPTYIRIVEGRVDGRISGPLTKPGLARFIRGDEPYSTMPERTSPAPQ